jgi:hypothetical protein
MTGHKELHMGMKTLVASDDITAVKPNGDRITIEVRVGMPYQRDVDEWGCPVSLSPLFNNIHDAVGSSSFQSICLALALILKLLTHFREDGGTLGHDDGTPYPLEAHFFAPN